MAQFPALPLFTDAYLGDTTHLTTIEHGAYLLLLIAMWRNKCTLPNNDKLLSRYARLTPAQWRRIKPVIWPFFDVSETTITQGRLTDEAYYVKRKSKQSSDAAKVRWLKNKDIEDAGALPERYTHTHTHKEEKTETKVSAKKGCRIPDNFEPDFKFAIEAGLSGKQTAIEALKFRDYWISQPGQKGVKLDWPATWRNWVRNAQERKPKPNGQIETRGQKVDKALQDIFGSEIIDGDEIGKPTN